MSKNENVIVYGHPFDWGEVMVSPGVMQRFAQDHVGECLCRHQQCDWGDVSDEDWLANAQALRTDGRGRMFSQYRVARSGTLWIITASGWNHTFVLLLAEY